MKKLSWPLCETVLENLEKQLLALDHLTEAFDVSVSTDTHSFFYLRAAKRDVEKAINNFKTAFMDESIKS